MENKNQKPTRAVFFPFKKKVNEEQIKNEIEQVVAMYYPKDNETPTERAIRQHDAAKQEEAMLQTKKNEAAFDAELSKLMINLKNKI